MIFLSKRGTISVRNIVVWLFRCTKQLMMRHVCSRHTCAAGENTRHERVIMSEIFIGIGVVVGIAIIAVIVVASVVSSVIGGAVKDTIDDE